MKINNVKQVVMTPDESLRLGLFLDIVSCPDSKVSCDICPFYVQHICLIGRLRGVYIRREIHAKRK